MRRDNEGAGVLVAALMAIVILCGLAAGGCWGYPQYRVYTQRMEGEALLKRAETEKQIILETAKAEAQAELERAKALVESIEITGKALEQYPEYTRHRFIEGLHDESTEVIYLPIDETGMPRMFTHPLKPLPTMRKGD